MVSNINDVSPSKSDPYKIEHTANVNYVDPPSTRNPKNRINTNRVPPTVGPE